MKRFVIILSILAVAIIGIVILKYNAGTALVLWNVSRGGTWLLPLVMVSSLLDSVHPCSFSILLITIAFLFSTQMTRRKILQVGGTYIAGIFVAYFLIGLGLLKTLNLFNTPHFMGKLGATLLIVFGILNIINEFFPRFPLQLRLPQSVHTTMGRLMERISIPAAFGLGLLVGVCQFPCMGGPYLMVIGLLHDSATYMTGFWYLVLYNLILIIPLAVVLYVAGDKAIVEKMQEWKRSNVNGFKLWVGTIMIILGIFIFFI